MHGYKCMGECICSIVIQNGMMTTTRRTTAERQYWLTSSLSVWMRQRVLHSMFTRDDATNGPDRWHDTARASSEVYVKIAVMPHMRAMRARSSADEKKDGMDNYPLCNIAIKHQCWRLPGSIDDEGPSHVTALTTGFLPHTSRIVAAACLAVSLVGFPKPKAKRYFSSSSLSFLISADATQCEGLYVRTYG